MRSSEALQTPVAEALAAGHARLAARVQFYLDEGHWERAMLALQLLCELEPEDVSYPLALAEVHLQLGQGRRAEELVDEVVRRQPENDDAHVSLALVHLRAGRLLEAVTLLDGVVSRDPRGERPAARRARAVAAWACASMG